jgi:methyl-accepting chemotaxis protein
VKDLGEWRRVKAEMHERHRRMHAHHRHLWRAEREMWRKAPHRSHWLPWWLQSRMRWRIFAWMTLAVAAGGLLGYHLDSHPRWWQIGAGLIVLAIASGAIAWRITRPLIMVIGAARDIGDGKLELSLDTGAHGGEVRVLASAINDMAAKIRQQLADQRQLLAAVSHELRTPPAPRARAAARRSTSSSARSSCSTTSSGACSPRRGSSSAASSGARSISASW